jgi:hypothetical protein
MRPLECRRAHTVACVRTILAALDMTAERSRPTNLDRGHDAPLGEAHVSAVGVTPSRAVVTEDIYCLLSQSFFRRAFEFE